MEVRYKLNRLIKKCYFFKILKKNLFLIMKLIIKTKRSNKKLIL